MAAKNEVNKKIERLKKAYARFEKEMNSLKKEQQKLIKEILNRVEQEEIKAIKKKLKKG